MLKSSDYVDPILAKKIVNLQAQLSKIQSSKTQILNNNKSLQVQTKNKLLKYQLQCQQNIKQLLAVQRDKLADYLDQQTNIITKDNRKLVSHHHKNSFTLNQSTRIDLSTDDSKSFELTRKSETITKSINSIHFNHQSHYSSNYNKFSNKNRVKLRRMTRKIGQQQKLINMLTLWVKIYHQREQQQNNNQNSIDKHQNDRLAQENRQLKQKCNKLQSQIQSIRLQFRMSSQKALQSHRIREQLRNENKQYHLKRTELLNNIRSLQKHTSKAKCHLDF